LTASTSAGPSRINQPREVSEPEDEDDEEFDNDHDFGEEEYEKLVGYGIDPLSSYI
jgi:hypothetical protein